MGSNDGSTLGLDFSKGLVFAEKVFQSTGFSVHPMEDSEIFTMVVSFGRHSFRLNEDSVAAALEAAIGGSGIDLMVFLIKDKVFGFQVSCKAVAMIIISLRSFACDHFKCYFHLWSNGGPNWSREFRIWNLECDAEWILVSPSKRRAALGVLAMHSRPSKSSFKSSNSVGKKLSFAVFQNYNACRGYRYPATENCIQTTEDAGYSIPPHERVVIHPAPPVSLRWTSTRPSILFGTVQDLLPLSDRSPTISGGNSGTLNVDVPTRATGHGLLSVGSDRAGPASSADNLDIPSSQQARDDFEDLISNMVDEVLTCQKCLRKGHFAASCTSKLWCISCLRTGHIRKDCNKFAQVLGLVWQPKSTNATTSEARCENISLTTLLPNLDLPSTSALTPSSSSISPGPKTPSASPPETPPPPLHSPSLEAEPSVPMANFHLDPQLYVPAGHHVIDGGEDRLPRTFVSPHTPIVRRHEEFMLAEVMPIPQPDEIGAAREAVVQWLHEHGVLVRSAQPWIRSVGLFELRDAAVRFHLLQLPPQPLGNDRFVRFMKHDEGENFRGVQGFRQGLLMFLGIPLDLRNTECIRAAVNTFGKFHHWVSEDPYLVRSLVFASFPEDILVPRDVVFMDFAPYGGARVSWTAPLYILGANFAEQMPQDEDWMPINGNPHPVPGVPFPEMPPFNLPAFPALGWNAVPPAPVVNEIADDNWGNWDDNVAPDPVQDQESMVVDLSAQPSSAADAHVPPVVVLDDEQPEAPVTPPFNEEFAPDHWAIVVYQPPVIREEFVMPAVPYGPPLPPDMIWRRSFESLLQAPMVFSVPKPVSMQPLSPVVLSKRSWDFAFSDLDLPRLTWKDQEVARPVARALFVDSAPDQVVPPVSVVTARRPRQPLAPTPIVDTAVRRCTRSSVKRDGFKPVFHELAIQPKKKKPRAKPFTAHESEEQASEEIPLATPIARLQEIGRELEIDATLLSVDALMVDPPASASVDPDV